MSSPLDRRWPAGRCQRLPGADDFGEQIGRSWREAPDNGTDRETVITRNAFHRCGHPMALLSEPQQSIAASLTRQSAESGDNGSLPPQS